MTFTFRRPLAARLLVSFVALAAVGACASDSLSPFQPQVSSPTDNFQLQATNVTNVTSTVIRAWVNTGTRATINHSTTTTAGSTLLVIKDAAAPTRMKPSLLGTPDELKWTASGKDVVVNLPAAPGDAAKAQYAFVLKLAGLGR